MKQSIAAKIYGICGKLKRLCRRLFVDPVVKKAFRHVGQNVRLASQCKFWGIENVSIGSNVSLGDGMRIMTTKAQVIIGNNVMFGPEVLLVSGDHRIDLLDKYMCEVTDAEKLPENDQDIFIEGDCWIGARAIILKGVTIGKGSVVAAGSIVTKSCAPYSIIAGAPAKVIKQRFIEQEIETYEENLAKR